MMAPQLSKIFSDSKAGSKKSIWPGKSQMANWMKVELAMSSFTIWFVLSRKSVSFGDILWNTTFWIDDLPLLQRQ